MHHVVMRILLEEWEPSSLKLMPIKISESLPMPVEKPSSMRRIKPPFYWRCMPLCGAWNVSPIISKVDDLSFLQIINLWKNLGKFILEPYTAFKKLC